MKEMLLVAVGGGIGAVTRYKLGVWLLGFPLHQRFPLGTAVINIVGCLVAGMLVALFPRWGVTGVEWRLFVFTGLLGGFTTFSAFGVETVEWMRRGEVGTALLYVAVSLLGGLAAVWIGYKSAS